MKILLGVFFLAFSEVGSTGEPEGEFPDPAKVVLRKRTQSNPELAFKSTSRASQDDPYRLKPLGWDIGMGLSLYKALNTWGTEGFVPWTLLTLVSAYQFRELNEKFKL